MKTIIVATDFSKNANNALEYAAGLAACAHAEIVLFHAFQLPVHASNTLLSAKAYDEILTADEERLKALAKSASVRYGITVHSFIKMSSINDELDKLVADLQADLVVMGMHENDWSDKLLGNTTTAVIRQANYPVLVVPENASFAQVEKLLYAFDNSCVYVPNTLSSLKNFANNFKAEVQVFHVESPKSTLVERKENAASSIPVVEMALSEVEHCYRDVTEDDVVQAIEKGVQEFDADILVMVPHKLSFWEVLLNKSKTREMALRTHVPLLVLSNSATGSIGLN